MGIFLNRGESTLVARNRSDGHGHFAIYPLYAIPTHAVENKKQPSAKDRGCRQWLGPRTTRGGNGKSTGERRSKARGVTVRDVIVSSRQSRRRGAREEVVSEGTMSQVSSRKGTASTKKTHLEQREQHPFHEIQHPPVEGERILPAALLRASGSLEVAPADEGRQIEER